MGKHQASRLSSINDHPWDFKCHCPAVPWETLCVTIWKTQFGSGPSSLGAHPSSLATLPTHHFSGKTKWRRIQGRKTVSLKISWQRLLSLSCRALADPLPQPFSEVLPRSAVSGSPGNLLEKQILGAYPDFLNEKLFLFSLSFSLSLFLSLFLSPPPSLPPSTDIEIEIEIQIDRNRKRERERATWTQIYTYRYRCRQRYIDIDDTDRYRYILRSLIQNLSLL